MFRRLLSKLKGLTVDVGFWDDYSQEGDGGIGTTAHSSRGFGLCVKKGQ